MLFIIIYSIWNYNKYNNKSSIRNRGVFHEKIFLFKDDAITLITKQIISTGNVGVSYNLIYYMFYYFITAIK